MTAYRTVTRFTDLDDVPAGNGMWVRENNVLLWKPESDFVTTAQFNTLSSMGATFDRRIANEGAAKNNQLDFTQFSAPIGTQLTFPTGYPGNDVVEPSILFDDTAPFFADVNGKNGYEYVACIGGYYQSSILYESANLWVSHDGTNWIYVVFASGIGTPTPGYTGVLTPVIPQGVQGDNSISDPYLVRGPDGTYFILFNQFLTPTGSGGTATGANNWGIKGVSATNLAGPWSTPVQLGPQTALAVDRPASPSAAWINGEWQIYGVQTIASPAARFGVIWKSTCATKNLLGTWVAQPDVVAPLPAAYSARQWWHLNVYRWGNRLILIVQDNIINSSSGGNLWILSSSDDGATWIVPPKPALIGNTFYRAAAIVSRNNNGEGLDFFYGNLAGSWTINRTFVNVSQALTPKYGGLTPNLLPVHSLEMDVARIPLPPYLFGDTVIRPNSVTSPGIADSGQTWSVTAGIVGISNKQFYATTSGNHKCAVVVPGAADGVYTCRFSVIDTAQQQWFIVRWKDLNNWVRIGYQSTGGYQIQNIVTASVTQAVIFPGPIAPVSGDVVTAVCSGQTITVWVNGNQIGQVTNYANNQTESGIGFQTNNVSNCRWDNFSLRTLIGGQ